MDKISRGQSIQCTCCVFRRQSVQRTKYPENKISKGLNVQRTKYPKAKVSRGQSFMRTKYKKDKVSKGQNVQRTKCPKDKVPKIMKRTKLSGGQCARKKVNKKCPWENIPVLLCWTENGNAFQNGTQEKENWWSEINFLAFLWHSERHFLWEGDFV